MDSDGLPIVGPNVDFTKVLCRPDWLILASMNLRQANTSIIHKTGNLAIVKQ